MSDYTPTPAVGAEIERALRQAASERILVLDGAMGTQIQDQKFSEEDFRAERFKGFNHDLKGNNDLLVLTQPEAIRDIHLAYFRAGADIVETNTFSGTSIAQADYGMESIIHELNAQGARLAREALHTDWIKLEVIGHPDTLQPDPFGLVEAARILTDEGFKVFPYTTEDGVLAGRLLDAGCEVLMPWGAPIGTGRGLSNPYGLRTLRAQFTDVPMVIDAGLGLPSHAAQAMEMGFDAVLLNTAVAKAGDPAAMAEGFARALEAGRLAFEADPMEPRDMAAPSTPVIGMAVLA